MIERLVFQDDKSSKFWEIEVNGSSHKVHYGKIGTDGQEKTKLFDSEEAALKNAEKLVKSKIKKGYKKESKTNKQNVISNKKNQKEMRELALILEDAIYLVQEENNNLIKEIITEYGDPIPGKLYKQANELNVDKNLIDLYMSYGSFTLEWYGDKNNGIGGRMKLLPIENIINSWEGFLYDDNQVAKDAEIRFFHPVDLITDEAQCGIIINPKNKDKSMYYNYSEETELYDLELDFKGYLKMAIEAKVFSYCPIVLLEIKNDKVGPHTERFREHMPNIFSGFDFNKFVDTYEELRLSNK